MTIGPGDPSSFTYRSFAFSMWKEVSRRDGGVLRVPRTQRQSSMAPILSAQSEAEACPTGAKLTGWPSVLPCSPSPNSPLLASHFSVSTWRDCPLPLSVSSVDPCVFRLIPPGCNLFVRMSPFGLECELLECRHWLLLIVSIMPQAQEAREIGALNPRAKHHNPILRLDAKFRGDTARQGADRVGR